MNTSSSSSTSFCRLNNPMLSSSFVKAPPIFERRDFLFFPAHERNFIALKELPQIFKRRDYLYFPAREQNFKALKLCDHYGSVEDDEDEETKPESFSLIDSNKSTDSTIRWKNHDSFRKVLGSGIVLLKNYINLVGQVEIVNLCQKWGVDKGGFYKSSRNFKDAKDLRKSCFGRNWDPITKYKNPCRSDGSEPPPIPNELISFTESIFENRDFDGLRDSISPDICVVNFYEVSGRLGLHQDIEESSRSPVVSISIGDTAEFYYGHTRNENKLERVLLESGDVLIFGGESRLIFHEVKKIVRSSCPGTIKRATRLNQGRLNLTLKEV